MAYFLLDYFNYFQNLRSYSKLKSFALCFVLFYFIYHFNYPWPN